MINPSGSNYPYLEQISVVPKIFEPLRNRKPFPEGLYKTFLICGEAYPDSTKVFLSLWLLVSVRAKFLFQHSAEKLIYMFLWVDTWRNSETLHGQKNNSKTSMTRAPIARLPGQTPTRFRVHRKLLNNKQILRDILGEFIWFHHKNVSCVNHLESPYWGGFNERIRWTWIAFGRKDIPKSLRKHAYSDIFKISPPKTESFQIKILMFFHISAQNIDCGIR